MHNRQNERLAYLVNLCIHTNDIVTGLQFSNLYHDYVTRPRYLKYQKILEGVEEIETEELQPHLPLTVHGIYKDPF